MTSPATPGWHPDPARLAESGDEGDSCPHRFVRGLVTALGLAMAFWLVLAAAVIVAWSV